MARLGRLEEARAALVHGSRLAPEDKRFFIELAGVAYKQKKQSEAIAFLHRALRIDPQDEYANDFLATLYFLQGNLEAAVQYWNRAGKPRISQVRTAPPPHVRPSLLDHAFAFAPASTLKLEELRASDARLQSLEIFPSYRFDLVAQPDGTFDTVFHAQELNGWGSTKAEALLRAFGGLPFQEVTPDYFNFHGSAINLVSLFRWDPDKRRVQASLSGPLGGDPRWRVRLGTDLRNENWDITGSVNGGSPLAALNLRREALAAEISRLMGARWKWSLGAEFSHRDYRNVLAGSALTPQLLAGNQLKQSARLDYELWRSAEHRFTVTSNASTQTGRLWSQSNGTFEKLTGSVESHWLPRARGDDFETDWKLGAGKTFGQLPFDELFMLGLERDNDLWLRAHIGTRNGRKGSAPLGRDYFLSNWETDKNVWSNGLVTVKVGPFVDTGHITGLASTLSTQQWLWDTGGQLKLRALGLGAVLSYGKDLRTGQNAVYVRLGR
ncbi:MAG TPA: tetratricopeptide repeat protein [Candidatus Angelobacter sp.]|nr:tetratricopeptide repeat protein [Candidatus Angelobacter sp.]